MSTPNQVNFQSNLSRVLEKISQLAEKSAGGDYIFRGEPKDYLKVSSSLYRQYEYDIETNDLDIEFVQKEILDEVRKYTEKTDELEILIELLYHGATTNLIGFTTDSHVALFFACDGSPTEDGRIILQKRDSVARYLRQPHEPKRRMIAQKTVFVQPPNGFVNPDEVITIPADLKLPVLEYLRKFHGIFTETIYNDLHGFITDRSIHERAYTQFYKGRSSQQKGNAAKSWKEKLKWYEKTVLYYTEALELKPDFPEGYNNRGTVYADAGDFDRAIEDHNMAIKLKPDYASAYNNRGIAYYHKSEYDRAIEDHNMAIKLKPDYASAYNNLGVAYSKQGEYERAIRYYSTVIKLKPDFLEGYNNRGIAYYNKGEYDRAIHDFNTVIELDPYDAKVYANLGTAYLRKRNFKKAIDNHNMAIKLEPDFAGFYSNRGETWLHLKKWEKAKVDLNTAKDMGRDIIASFHNDYESVEDFEGKNDIQLPEDIAALLRQAQN